MIELRKDLEERLKEDTKLRNKKNRQDSLLKALVEQLDVELPKTLIDQEIRNIIEQAARNLAQQGIDVKSTFTPELINKLMESSLPEAEDNLRQNFAIKALAEQEDISVSEKEIKDKLNEVKKEFSKEKNIDQEKLKEAIYSDLLQDKVFIWLEENNNVLEKSSKAKATSNNTAKKKDAKSKTKPEKSSQK